jgi:hypothetical protein
MSDGDYEVAGNTAQQKQGRIRRHFGKVKAKLVAAFKKYGWKIGVLIVLGYLIRDTLLYIVIPYLIAKKIAAG